MADMVGPFNGTAPWSEGEWYNFAPAWAPSGIIGTPAASVGVGDFAVTSSGLNVTVACNGDRAWIDGSGYKPDTDKTLTVTANGNASLSRRDRLVIRRDLAAKTIAVVRLAGTPAGTPSAPALTQISGGVYDIPICSFLIPPNNGTTLTGFVDERGWVDARGAGPIGFASTAARDANFPMPTADQMCVVNGVVQVYTGSRWAPTVLGVSGSGGGNTNPSGQVVTTHGLGTTPAQVFLTTTTSAIQHRASYVVTAKTSTTFTVTLYDSTNGVALSDNPASFDWLAVA